MEGLKMTKNYFPGNTLRNILYLLSDPHFGSIVNVIKKRGYPQELLRIRRRRRISNFRSMTKVIIRNADIRRRSSGSAGGGSVILEV